MFEWIVRHRWWVVAATVAATALFATQLPKLRFDPNTEAYVPVNHPVRRFWREARERFGIGREILVALEARGPEGIFTPRMLQALRDLTDGIKGLDGVIAEEVRSLADAEAIVGTEEGLEVRPFFEEPPHTLAEARAIRAEVFRNAVYLDRLVSRDGKIAVILVPTHHAVGKSPTEVYEEIAAYVAAHPVKGARILIAGDPAVEAVFGRQMAADLERLIPLAMLVVIVVLFLCFPGVGPVRLAARAAVLLSVVLLWQQIEGGPVRLLVAACAALAGAMLTVRGVLLPVLVVAISVVWTWGMQAALGLPIYIAGTLVPPLLLAIGCADGIHILERYYEKAGRYSDRDRVVLGTMEELWRPVVLTSLTTAAGFGSLMAGSMTVYRVFGFTTAFGILVAMLMSLTLLPAALAILPLPRSRPRNWSLDLLPRGLMALGRWIAGHRKLVLAAGILAAIGFRIAAEDLRIDYSWVESLSPDSPVLEADRVLRSRYGGTTPFNIIVRAPQPDGIKDPAVLEAMDRVLEELAERPEVGDTRSIAEYLKRMNQAMHGDRSEAYRIPATRELVAQYLLLYSMSGNPAELDDMVDYDYQAANLSFRVRGDRLHVIQGVVEAAQRAIDEHLRPLGLSATLTGAGMVLKTVMDMIFQSQVYSLATATMLVLVSLCVLFRSLRDALVCMVGPLFTGIANFGGMALLGVPLGPEKAMIGAIALGIGIDYSIHLMSRFRDVAGRGMSVNEAIVEAMRTTGRAILFNALVVVAGFLVLGFSKSPSNVTFGLMIAANMAVSCAAALTLLPAVLAVMGHYQQARLQTEPAPVAVAGADK